MSNLLLTNIRPNGKPAGISQSLIADDLKQVERILNQKLSPYRAQFGSLTRHLNHYRGKRLRPMLLLLIAHACGRATPSHHVLAAVVELIHTATLLHDDVLDEADTRRHVCTINACWGNKISILLGDLLFTNAFHLSSTIGDSRACEWIGEATNRVCTGELLQTLQRGNLELSEDDYMAVVGGKTASLTEACGRLGAFYAGADAEQVERLAGFGRNLGIAFQIADDVLDLVGSEKTAGKTLGTDLQQRKLTLPLIYLFDRATDVEVERFRAELRARNGDLRKIREALRETGAIEAARLRAEEFADRAREALHELPASAYRSKLEAITGWSVRRTA